MANVDVSARTAELRQGVQVYLDVHASTWPDGRGPDYLPEDYSHVLESLIVLFRTGLIPQDCQRLNEAVIALSQQLDLFDASGDSMPGDGFWAAKELLEARFHETNPGRIRTHTERLESMAELVRQQIPYEQIARMHHWFLADGATGNIRMVEEELAQPGRHRGPNWVHPLDLAEEAKQQRARAEFANIVEQSKAPPAPAPETLDDLWYQDVSAEQAAKMLGLPLAEVKAEYAKLEKAKAEQKKARQLADLQSPDGEVTVEPTEEADVDDNSDLYAASFEELKQIAKAEGVGIGRGRPNKQALIKKIQLARSQAGV